MPINRIEDWTSTELVPTAARWQEEAEDSSLPAWMQRVEHFLVDHPQTTVVAALVLGLTLGWLGKRK